MTDPDLSSKLLAEELIDALETVLLCPPSDWLGALLKLRQDLKHVADWGVIDGS